MWRLAFRNLFQKKGSLAVSVGGVALALTLVLTLDAVFSGVESQLSGYIDHSGAEVWVAQSGVRSLHMASSWLPASAVEDARAVPGVASVTPIMYTSEVLKAS